MFDIDGGLADLSAFVHLLAGDSEGSRRQRGSGSSSMPGRRRSSSRAETWWRRWPVWGWWWCIPRPGPSRAQGRPGCGSTSSVFHPDGRCCAALVVMSDRRSRSRPATVEPLGRGCRHSSTTNQTPWTHYAPAGCGRIRSTSCRACGYASSRLCWSHGRPPRRAAMGRTGDGATALHRTTDRARWHRDRPQPGLDQTPVIGVAATP